jgi:hypothetical protein
MSEYKHPLVHPEQEAGELGELRPARRLKFGTAAEGWDAYNDWVQRVRQNSGPGSRQAVIAKALYSVSSYKNWAEKARDAFDEKD